MEEEANKYFYKIEDNCVTFFSTKDNKQPPEGFEDIEKVDCIQDAIEEYIKD